MGIANYVNRFRQYLRRGSQRRRPPKFQGRLCIEQLEDRMVPATLFVAASGDAHYIASNGVANNVTLSERRLLVDPPPPGAAPPIPFFLENLLTDTAEKITVTGPGASRWVGSGTNQVGTFLPIPSLLVDVVDGNDVVNVKATDYPATVRHFGPGIDTVNVGNAGQLVDVKGSLAVLEAGFGGGSTRLNVDDSTDGASHGNVFLSGSLIANLGPAFISYAFANGPSSVTVTGGSGNNVYNVLGPSVFTTLNTGSGLNLVNVRDTVALLNVLGHGGNDTVIVGSQAPALGGIQANILAPVFVANTTNSTTLLVDNKGDSVPRFVQIDPNRIQFLGTGSPIHFFAGVKSVDVFGGNSDTFVIQAPPLIPVNIFGGAGNNTLVGANVANLWNILSTNAGNVGKVAFTSIQNLVGGAGPDTFRFADQAGVTGNINGGPGFNTLDYSAYTTPVFVNLVTKKATGVGGFVFNITNVIL